MFRGKPIIGLTPLYDDEKESYWMLPGYMLALEAAGAVPLMLPLTTEPDELDYFLEVCDGFVLTGGHDVSPSLYHAQVSEQCGITSALRDGMDSYILIHAVERNMAVLGICRGMQLMNAVYGGTLYQDIPTEFPSGVEHHMSPPYSRISHMIQITPDTPLAELLQLPECGVNSYHHQAIQRLAAPLRAMATAPDGIIEAVYFPDKSFVWGVQWHPEFSWRNDEISRKIFDAFLVAAGKTSATSLSER